MKEQEPTSTRRAAVGSVTELVDVEAMRTLCKAAHFTSDVRSAIFQTGEGTTVNPRELGQFTRSSGNWMETHITPRTCSPINTATAFDILLLVSIPSLVIFQRNLRRWTDTYHRRFCNQYT